VRRVGIQIAGLIPALARFLLARRLRNVIIKQQQEWEVMAMRAVIALMPIVVAALLLGATAAPQAALAQTQQRWCLRTGSGNSDCTFTSLAQCKASRSGLTSGTCFRARRQHRGTPAS
jgi:hypothetical protein